MHQSKNSAIAAKVITVLAILLCLFVLAHTVGAFGAFHIYFPDRVYRAVVLTFLLLITFLASSIEKGKRQGKLAGLNVLFALMSISGLVYFIFFFNQAEIRFYRLGPSPIELTVAMLTLVLTIEAIRRLIGLPMALVTLVFFLYPFTTQYLPGLLHGRVYSVWRVSTTMFISSDGLLGTAMGVAAGVVFLFVMLGNFLVYTGAGKFFIDVALGLFGSVRGGSAKAAVVASALFGTISGASSANAATTGMITIPLMKKAGYSSSFAGAVEAVAANGGPLLPPVMGAVAFMIAEFLAMPYIMVCFYAAVPAVLYYLAVFAMVDLEAARTGLTGVPRHELPSVRQTMKKGWVYLLPIVLLVFLLAVLLWSPEKSAFWSMIGFWVISLFKKETRMGLAAIVHLFEGTAKAMLVTGLACAGAGIVIGAVSVTGLGLKFSGALIDISGGSMLVLLILTAIACFILGMGVGAITIYVTLAVLVAPTLIQMGAVPIAAHLFVFWWGLTAYITPPVAVTAFITAGIAKASPMKTALQATRLGINNLLLPFMFMFKPALILIGSLGEVMLAVVFAILAVTGLAASLVGYLLTPIRWQRIPLFVGALCLLLPEWRGNMVGLVLLAAVVFWQTRDLRARRPTRQLAGS